STSTPATTPSRCRWPTPIMSPWRAPRWPASPDGGRSGRLVFDAALDLWLEHFLQTEAADDGADEEDHAGEHPGPFVEDHSQWPFPQEDVDRHGVQRKDRQGAGRDPPLL